MCGCVRVFAADEESGEDERSMDGLVCCRLCLTSFARCRMKLPPPHFFFPLFSLASLLRQIQQTGKKWSEWPRCNQHTIWAPSWVPAPCFYACLIGQKQHAWLCSQGNSKTLEWAGGLDYAFLFFLLLACLLFSSSCVFFREHSHWLYLSYFFSLSSFSFLLSGSWRCVAPGMFTATTLPSIPSSASLESHCDLPGCCRCRLVCLDCCYRVVTWFQPTFKMAE